MPANFRPALQMNSDEMPSQPSLLQAVAVSLRSRTRHQAPAHRSTTRSQVKTSAAHGGHRNQSVLLGDNCSNAISSIENRARSLIVLPLISLIKQPGRGLFSRQLSTIQPQTDIQMEPLLLAQRT